MRSKDPNRFFQERDKRGWSQRKVAKEVGCSQTMIHMLETGKVQGADRSLATEISRVYGVDLEELFEVPESSSVAEVSSALQDAESVTV